MLRSTLRTPLRSSRMLLRTFASEAAPSAPAGAPPAEGGGGGFIGFLLGAAVGAGGLYAYESSKEEDAAAPVAAAPAVAAPAAPAAPAGPDYAAIRGEIESIFDEDDTRGPFLVRLAWHSSGTYCGKTGTGGSEGATMRFSPEADHGANAGLAGARKLLEGVKARHPGITYADLYTLAGAHVIELMGGPHIAWRPGRSDASGGHACTPDGRLPDADKGSDKKTSQHVRDIFYRMGFNDREIVALVGAHTLGECHDDRSGYKGPWSRAPTTFSNLYFKELFDNKWKKKKWDGPMQYADKSGDLMMLPADMVMARDKGFRKWAELYYEDEDFFFQQFAAAYVKLLELGCPTLADKEA
eukprot:PLAT13458.1.p1 GENE.PLAT13458.1~~PLAT13458.1.p1  ORF type:complete len:355 (+),score=172.32 PLAT13458.1:33-1097(+)